MIRPTALSVRIRCQTRNLCHHNRLAYNVKNCACKFYKCALDVRRKSRHCGRGVARPQHMRLRASPAKPRPASGPPAGRSRQGLPCPAVDRETAVDMDLWAENPEGEA